MSEKQCPVCGSPDAKTVAAEAKTVAPQEKQDYERRLAELEARVAALEAALFGHQPAAGHFAKPCFPELEPPEKP